MRLMISQDLRPLLMTSLPFPRFSPLNFMFVFLNHSKHAHYFYFFYLPLMMM